MHISVLPSDTATRARLVLASFITTGQDSASLINGVFPALSRASDAVGLGVRLGTGLMKEGLGGAGVGGKREFGLAEVVRSGMRSGVVVLDEVFEILRFCGVGFSSGETSLHIWYAEGLFKMEAEDEVRGESHAGQSARGFNKDIGARGFGGFADFFRINIDFVGSEDRGRERE